MPMFYRYTAFYAETGEIRTCTSLKTLYKAVRSDLRYNASCGRPPVTVKFYIDQQDFDFGRKPAFYVMGWTD